MPAHGWPHRCGKFWLSKCYSTGVPLCLKRLTLGLLLLGKRSILVSTFCIVVWRSRCHQLGEVDGLARGYPTALRWPEALLSLQTKGYLHRNLWRKSESLSCPLPCLSSGEISVVTVCPLRPASKRVPGTRLLVGVMVAVLLPGLSPYPCTSVPL